MGLARHHRQAGRMQHRLHARRAILVALALPVGLLQVADRRHDRGADRRRQRGGEDEARRIGAHRVDDVRARRDVAAEAAERLCERAFQHVDAMHLPFARADAAAARAVHADRVHLVAIGHRAVFLGEIADRLHRRDVAVHRIEPLEGDQLRPLRRLRGEQLLEMRRHRCGARSPSGSRPGARPRSSNCGSARRTGSGSPAAAWRWSRCRSGSTRSPK